MNGVKEAYTTQEIARIWSVDASTVIRRAKREGWQSRPRAGRGGGNEWFVASMPESTRLIPARHTGVKAPQIVWVTQVYDPNIDKVVTSGQPQGRDDE